MRRSTSIKLIAALAVNTWTSSLFAHIVLENKAAPAASYYKAVLQVGHGCQGAATTGVSVTVPAGFKGAKPMPKAGWLLSTTRAALATPYDSHGKRITDDVAAVTWTAASPAAALADAHYDEFVLRGQLPDAPGPLWFAVRQSCADMVQDWAEIPASGTSTQGLKLPAALLQVTPAATPSAAAPTMPAGMDHSKH